MDEASWLALTATLTILGVAWTVWAARRRGLASTLRAAGLTVAVPALYLTDTLDTLVDIGTEITSWATRLVFSPTVWLGVALAGVSALLLGASSFLRSRELARGGSRTSELPAAEPGRRGSSGGSGDAEMDEIEEILRRRGIS